MVVVMEKNASSAEIEQVQERLRQAGFKIHLSQGVERTIIGAIGDRSQVDLGFLEALPGVEKVVPIMKPFKLTSREFKPDDTVVTVGDLKIGDGGIQVIAGPCAVESREKYLEAAMLVKESGATMLRGGAFKPRTSPYSFQGLEEEGLKILAEARELTGLPVVTEVMDQRSVELVARCGCSPDRCPQYAEFLSVAGSRQDRQAGGFETRALRHPGGVDHGGRIHSFQRKSPGYYV